MSERLIKGSEPEGSRIDIFEILMSYNLQKLVQNSFEFENNTNFGFTDIQDTYIGLMSHWLTIYKWSNEKPKQIIE